MACQARSTTATLQWKCTHTVAKKPAKTICPGYLPAFSSYTIFSRSINWKWTYRHGSCSQKGAPRGGLPHTPQSPRPSWLHCPQQLWASPPRGALPVGCRGTRLCFSTPNPLPSLALGLRHLHFHSQQIWDYERRQLSHRPWPFCNTQSDRGAPRTNLADSRGSHPTWIWTRVY